MNRYTKDKIKNGSIIKQMALLREQRNLVKAIHCMHEDDSVATKEDRLKVQALMGLAGESQILAYLRGLKVLLTDRDGKFPTKFEQKGHFGRTSKIAVLLQSCVDDGFLIPVNNRFKPEDDTMTYYRLTGKGTDLLHPLGFCQLLFDKYSKIIVFFWGALSILALKLVTWCIENWGSITAFFDSWWR